MRESHTQNAVLAIRHSQREREGFSGDRGLFRSYTHADAEVAAVTVASLPDRDDRVRMAIRVAELARWTDPRLDTRRHAALYTGRSEAQPA